MINLLLCLVFGLSCIVFTIFYLNKGNIILCIFVVFFGIMFMLILVFSELFKTRPQEKYMDKGAFDNSNTVIDTFWVYKTFVGVEDSEQLVPAMVNVYGEKALQRHARNDGSIVQFGYTIRVPALTTISSRFQGSLEYAVGPRKISKVFISWSDTSKAEWKNCKKTIQW